MEGVGWKYSAFISYRHDPDAKMAREIQNEIERYIVPKKWRNSELVDGKNLKKVFRDSTEFSGENDLTQAIRNALDGSAFLIVMVSEKTKLSPWVPQEINYFLAHHDRRRIITVLTDGDNPINCYPEMLLKKQMSDGSVIDIEPLAVDYRGFEIREKVSMTEKPRSRKQIKRSELPRILAPMLGIGYDDIVQRNRTYRRRRNSIIISAAFLLFSIALIYVIWSNIQINKNYQEALKKQALILAEESENALEEGDRVAALEYAVEALPDKKRKKNLEMPITPEAEFSLSNALDAYVVPGNVEHSVPIRKMSMSGGVSKMWVSKSNMYILGIDDNNGIRIFDIENNVYKDYSLNPYADNISISEYNDQYYVIDELENSLVIKRYNILSEENVKTIDLKDYGDYPIISYLDIKEGKIVFNFFYSMTGTSKLILFFVDCETGNIDTEEINFEYDYPSVERIQVDNERHMAFYLKNNSNSTSELFLYDLEENNYKRIHSSFEEIKKLDIVDGYVYIVGQKTSDGFDMMDPMGYSGINEFRGLYRNDRNINICKLDDTGKEIWNSVVYIDTFSGIPNIINYTQDDKEYIAVTVSNLLVFLDPKTGEVMSQFRYPARILSENINQSQEVLLSNGEIGWVWKASITGENLNYRADNIIKYEKLSDGKIFENSTTKKKLIIVKNSGEDVIVYEQRYGDRTFVPFTSVGSGDAFNDEILRPRAISDNIVVSAGYDNNSNQIIYCLDLKTDNVLWTASKNDLDGKEYFREIGIYHSSVYVTAMDDNDSYVLEFNLDNGAIINEYKINEIFELNENTNHVSTFSDDTFVMRENTIYSVFKEMEGGSTSIIIKSYSFDTHELRTTEVCTVEDIYVSLDKIYLDEKEEYAIIKNTMYYDDSHYENKFLLYNISHGNSVELEELGVNDFVGSAQYGVYFYEKYFYITTPSCIEKYDYSGKEKYKIDAEGQMIGGLAVNNSKLYTLWNSNEIKIYSEDKGDLIDSYEFDNYTLRVNQAIWHFVGEDLILENYSIGVYYGATYIFDMKEFKQKAVLVGAIAYNEDLDKFLMSYSNKTGTYKRHSLEELLDMAEEDLN